MLELEVLEARLALASLTLLGGTLSVLGDQADDVVDVFTSADGTQVVANVNGQVQTFPLSQVQQVFLDGAAGNDTLTSQVPGVVDVLRGGLGADSLQAFGRTSVVLGGSGPDVLYAIVGMGAILDGEAGQDRVIGNATSVIIPDPADRAPVVFGAGAAPFQLVNGVLLLVGSPGNDSGSLTRQGNVLTLVYNGQTATFDRGAVDAIASVLGGGDDSFANLTDVDTILYGGAGNDTLIGGGGNDLLKGGGGNDFLFGGGGSNDLTGDPGQDTVLGGQGNDVLRVDGLDLFLAMGGDRLVIRR